MFDKQKQRMTSSQINPAKAGIAKRLKDFDYERTTKNGGS